MASKRKIVEVVGSLCEAFSRKPSEATFAVYEMVLSEVTDEQLDLAGRVALENPGAFMPTPGQLRQFALTGGKTYEARAEIAWHEFDAAVAHHGGDRSVSFADGIINATVRLLGGWVLLCEKTGDDYFVWLPKQFKETYVRLCQSGANAELCGPLGGRLELENRIFPDEVLGKLEAYTGRPLLIKTSQPVIMPPADDRKRIERRGMVPVIEFKRA